ncbi:FAD-dependent oxidoreductase [Angustibacter luteus]|uniref:FAD-dependent oxidoreductase n=1 Tax=Angustibacter luteus TaxID=658456 RepID=A0ABW1JBN2_9ACTN
MKCVVVGAGAWGLPAAAELAGRGHEVVLVDRHGIANPLSSSPGPTRLWRLTHPDAVRVRLAQRSVEAMERLASRSGRTVHLRRGLLWRDDVSLPAVRAALDEVGVGHRVVAAADVATLFRGLRPDGRDAVWQEDAGPVLAAESMAAQAGLLAAAGGTVRTGQVVVDVRTTSGGVRLSFDDGSALDADVVVLAPGPGAAPLLEMVGLSIPLGPHLEQVVHFGEPSGGTATDDLPCLFDGPRLDGPRLDGHGPDGRDGVEPGLYAMPTPGRGYKVGLDRPLRDYVEGDLDRTPDEAVVAATRDRVARDLTGVPARVLDAQVCSWTDSPDRRFIIDTLPGGVVVACGDSGEGFKFSALMGIVLADLAEGQAPDPDVATFGAGRFAASAEPAGKHVLGR